MKASWGDIQEHVNHLKGRERRLLCITVVVLVLSVFAFLLWDPLYQAWLKDFKANAQAIRQVNSAQASIASLKERMNIDVNAHYKKQIKALKVQLEQQQQKIESLTSALITPKNMGQVFTGLLQESALTVNKISNLDAQAVKIEGQQEETKLLFQHGLSLELRGQFSSVLTYIQELEIQDWQLYWDELNFSTNNYPQGTLTVEVHTLSTSDSVLDL